jgi:hypothetical protein
MSDDGIPMEILMSRALPLTQRQAQTERLL